MQLYFWPPSLRSAKVLELPGQVRLRLPPETVINCGQQQPQGGRSKRGEKEELSVFKR